MAADERNESSLRFDLFELDARNCQLRRNGSPIEVPPQALRILALLTARPNELVTRGEIKETLWPDESHGDFDSRTNFAVKKLRDALGDSAGQPRYVQTVRNAGYTFIAPVRSVPRASSIATRAELGTVSVEPSIPVALPPLADDIQGTVGAPRRWPSGRWALMAAVLCVLLFGAYWVWREFHGAPVAQVSFSGSTLLARNGRGLVLWTYDFGQPLYPDPDHPARQSAMIVQMGPGRQGDVLVAAPLFSSDRASSPSDALFCLSPRGKLRWRHTFDDTFRFGGHDYGPPWEAAPLMVISGKSTAPSIWLEAQSVFWSTSTLAELDRDGHLLAQFVNWGHMRVLNHIRNASGSYILAGGISNQCDCAMLAILKEDSPSGSSPPLPGSSAICENCPEGRPYRYFLFPRSELTELSGTAYNNLKTIQVDGDHVWVAVAETASTQNPGPDWVKYDLSAEFVPQSFTVSDHYWTLHRQMEAEGKIHHTVEQCPERKQPKRVRMWSPEHGWQEIAVPVSTEP